MSHPMTTEERTAAALRTHAAQVAPPMHTDTAGVLRRARRHRVGRNVAGSLAVVAGVAALGLGGYQLLGHDGGADRVVPVAGPGTTAPSDEPAAPTTGPVVVWPDATSHAAAVAVVARLGEAPTADDVVSSTSIVVDHEPDPRMASTYRLVGTAPSGAEVFVGLDADGSVCMVTVGDGYGDGGTCSPLEPFLTTGLNLVAEDAAAGDVVAGAESLWVVADGFTDVPDGWERLSENLVLVGTHPVNAAGQTYGPPILDSTVSPPDLMLWTGDGGVVGYVVREELERVWGQDSGAVLPLWDAEGQTQVGTATSP